MQKQSCALVLRLSFERKRASVAEWKKDVPRDRGCSHRALLFLLRGPISGCLVLPCGSFFRAGVASSLSIQSFFFFFADCPCFYPLLFAFAPLLLVRESARFTARFAPFSLFRLSSIQDACTNLRAFGERLAEMQQPREKETSAFFFLELVPPSSKLQALLP